MAFTKTLQRSALSIARHFSAVVATALLVAPAWAQNETSSASTETYRDWIVRCGVSTSNGNQVRICQMTQELTRTTDNRRVLNVTIQKTDAGAGTTRLTTPLGVGLPQGVAISVEDAELARFQFLTCVAGGCIAQGVLEAPALQALQDGAQAQVSMINISTRAPLALNVSLLGFTAAWQRLGELSN